ncbi:hypothetical protein P8452_14141 [Trifolium repens]|nr:hypothetical protein P8452_14141 [Trifolium repens]
MNPSKDTSSFNSPSPTSLPLVFSVGHKIQFHSQFVVACAVHLIIRIWVIGILRVGTCIGKEIGEKDRKLEELITSHLSLLGVH